MASQETRQMLKEAGLKLAEFSQEKGIKTIVAMGPSAVYAARFVRGILRKQKPSEKIILHSVGRWEEQFRYWPYIKKQAEQITESFLNARPELGHALHSPILLLGEYTHTGRTLARAKRAFTENLGARKVYTAALCAAQGRISEEPQIVGARVTLMNLPPETRQIIYPRRTEAIEWSRKHRKAGVMKPVRTFWNGLLKEI